MIDLLVELSYVLCIVTFIFCFVVAIVKGERTKNNSRRFTKSDADRSLEELNKMQTYNFWRYFGKTK
jgi:hypothetical protein